MRDDFFLSESLVVQIICDIRLSRLSNIAYLLMSYMTIFNHLSICFWKQKMELQDEFYSNAEYIETVYDMFEFPQCLNVIKTSWSICHRIQSSNSSSNVRNSLSIPRMLRPQMGTESLKLWCHMICLQFNSFCIFTVAFHLFYF